MGAPRKQRRKYRTPMHPWQAARIEEEKKLKKEFGFVNKKEIWKVASKLKDVKDQAKHITANPTPQSEKEKKALLAKLERWGLIGKDATLDSVLELRLVDVIQRRLQSMVVSRGLARTPRQARQMIVHGHIAVSGQKMSVPSYFVKADEEVQVSFAADSPFASDDHPERTAKKKDAQEVVVSVEKPAEEAVVKNEVTPEEGKVSPEKTEVGVEA